MDDLARLVAARPNEIGGLAGRWLAEGARAVELWGPHGLAARWDPGFHFGPAARPTRPAADASAAPPRGRRGAGIRAEVVTQNGRAGWVRVLGTTGLVSRRRLDADAAVLTTLLEHEHELIALTDALAESQDRLLGLSALAAAGASAPTEAAVLDEIVRHVRATLGAEAVVAFLRDGASEAATSDPDLAPADLDVLGRAIADHVSRPLPAADRHVGRPRILRVSPWLVAGVELDGGSSLSLAVGPDATGATSEDVRLLVAAAEVGGSIVSRARTVADQVARARVDRELELAVEVQRHLVATAIRAIPSLDVAMRYRPASEIGGDILAVHEIEGCIVAAVGDVSGKGIAAALLMAAARAVFASAARSLVEPAAILERMSTELADDLERTGTFITLCVVRIDPAAGLVTIANAGHSPVFVLRHGAAPHLELPTEPPIGVADGVFPAVTGPFGSGDALVLASDGITDREDAAERRYGMARLRAALRQHAGGSAQTLADGILASVDRFAGEDAGRRDDETLLVVRSVG